MKVVNNSLTALYGGFRQYDQCCFHRQAIHWVKNDCEYCVGKYKSFEPGGGVHNSLIKVLFLLDQSPRTINCYKTGVWIKQRKLLRDFNSFPFELKGISKSLILIILSISTTTRKVSFIIVILPIKFWALVYFSEVHPKSCFLSCWTNLQHPSCRIVFILNLRNTMNSLNWNNSPMSLMQW